MEDNRYEPFPLLVECFYSTVEKSFSFLSVDLNFCEGERIINIGNGDKKYDKGTFPKNIWVFSASKKYKLNEESFEIIYGDKESFIEIIYKKGKARYALWQIYEAMDLRSQLISGSSLVQNTKVMENLLCEIAIGLKNNICNILPISQGIAAIIEANNKKRQLEWNLKEENRNMEAAIEKAANAFRERNYAKVVTILSEYENKLRPAQRMKLAYCKKHI